jgi:hypothetical protein
MRRAVVVGPVLVALVAAGCLSATPSSDTGMTTAPSSAPAAAASESLTPASGSPSEIAPSDTPVPSEPSDVPSEPSSSEAPSDVPSEPSSSEAPSDVPSAVPTPTATAASAAVCQPEGSNPNFWPGMAHSVSWDVYCAVLPKGWYVASGSYRLANGGKLVISYKGPSGATLALSEGSFCTDGGGCVPSGHDTGDAAFGAMDGTLVTLDSGGYAIVVARGATPSWLMVTSGLDQAMTMSLGAALAHVTG